MRLSKNAAVALILGLLACRSSLGQFSLPGFGQKPNSLASDQKTAKLLHDNLPLVLDANSAYPTVPDEDLLGGPFHGRPLAITWDTLTKPLPPGDYIVTTTFFCSEYSIHRPGEGTAYTLAPAQGSASTAISTLLWRGMLTGHSPQELQSVSWAIQGSVPYARMPPNYRKLIDQLVPDMRAQLNGQGWENIQTGMQGTVNRATKKFSDTLSKGLGAITGGRGSVDLHVQIQMNQQFQQLGRLGQAAIDGENISGIVQAAYPNDEAREQALYAGQGQQEPPIPAMDGPWSVIVPGVAYMRFIVRGGNLQGDNVMQIRLLPPSRAVVAFHPGNVHIIRAAYQTAPSVSAAQSPSLLNLFGGDVDLARFALCSVGTEGLGDLGPCEALAITKVAGTMGFGINAAVQAPIMVPTNIANAMTGSGGSGGGNDSNGGKRGTFWKSLKNFRDGIKTNGETGSARRFYQWDYTHNDIEVYNGRGEHLGSADAETGQLTKPAVAGRTLKL